MTDQPDAPEPCNGEPMGSLIDSLGVRHHPQDGELIVGAVVLLKVVEPDGRIGLRQAFSEGLDWIASLGMLTAAAAIETPLPYHPDERSD